MEPQKTHTASVSHEEWVVVASLRSDPEFAVEYLKQAMTEMNDPDGRGAALLVLHQIAESCGCIAKVAETAGVRRESLYRALSPKGNPTLNTLFAALKSVGHAAFRGTGRQSARMIWLRLSRPRPLPHYCGF